jgi:hypothetical protein
MPRTTILAQLAASGKAGILRREDLPSWLGPELEHSVNLGEAQLSDNNSVVRLGCYQLSTLRSF